MNSTPDASDLPPPAILAPGQLFRLDGRAGWTVHVLRGRIWLTEPGDATDHFIAAGQDHRLRQNEAVLLENDRRVPALLAWTNHAQVSAPMMTSAL